jgi:hypothetical protein
MLLFTRIVLSVTAIGGFLVSIYLIPLVLTYTCETLSTSLFSCLFRVSIIIILHFFVPIYFVFSLTTKDKRCAIALLAYGIAMGFMIYLTGFISLLVGIFCALSALYFIALQHRNNSSVIAD